MYDRQRARAHMCLIGFRRGKRLEEVRSGRVRQAEVVREVLDSLQIHRDRFFEISRDREQSKRAEK